MPLTVKHSKVSPVADGPDTNLVRPSDWNADHQITGLDSITDPVAVSVNSTSPAMKITQTGSGNALVVEDAASDSTPFVIDQSGSVVVGNTSALNSGSGVADIGVHGDSNGAPIIGATVWHASATFEPRIELGKSRGAIGTQASVLSGDGLGLIRFYGSDGTSLVQAAQISASVDGTPGVGDMPGRLIFSTTADGAASPTERMRIDSAGRVIDYAGVAQAPTRSTVASGSTIALTTATNHLLYDQSATVAALTVTLPSSGLVDGQIITIATRSAITALTVNGGTIYGAPTTLAAGEFASFIYSSGATAWFRKG